LPRLGRMTCSTAKVATNTHSQQVLALTRTIAAVRRALWCPEELSMSRPGQATVEIPITLLQRLVNTVGYAV